MKTRKHTFEFKVKVVNDYLNNEGGYKFLSKKYNVDTTQVRAWITQYYQFGYEGLSKSMTHTHYSGEFKRAVLQYRQENQLSYRETAIHFGIILVVSLAIGFVTPPLGVNLFVASSVGKVKLEKTAVAVVPFIIAKVIFLLIITFIPQLSMWLPSFSE